MRGVYPPIPTSYSPDLRTVINEKLQKDPSLRPSINQILRKPFVQKRIESFLNETLIKEEFSHTIILPKPNNPVHVRNPWSNKHVNYFEVLERWPLTKETLLRTSRVETKVRNGSLSSISDGRDPFLNIASGTKSGVDTQFIPGLSPQTSCVHQG